MQLMSASWFVSEMSVSPVTTVDGAGHPTSAALITGRQRRQCRQCRRSIYRDHRNNSWWVS